MPWPRRKLVTILDSGTILGGTGPGGGDILPVLDGLGVWYKADDGASSSFAAQFTGANAEFLSIPVNPTLQMAPTDSWTIGGWFYLDNVAAPQVLIRKPNPLDVDYQLYHDGLRFVVNTQASTNNASVAYTTIGTWVFALATYTPTSGGGDFTVQVNNGVPGIGSVAGPNLDTPTDSFTLGATKVGAAPLSGRMQNVFIFGRLLSVAERAFLWNGGTGRRFEELTASFKTQLRAWWPLDEVSGNRRDVSGNNNTLTDNNTVTQNAGWVRNQATNGGLIQFWNDSGPNDFDLGIAAANNAPTWIANERNGRAVARFDGVDDRMITAAMLGSVLAGPQAQTVFLVQAARTLMTNAPYSWDSSAGASTNELAAHLPATTVLYYITGDAGAGTGYLRIPVAPQPWMETWHIVEMVRNGTSTLNTITVEGNATVAGDIFPSASFNTAASASLAVGGRLTTPMFQGDIAELIIYNRALTPTERDSVRNYLKAKWGIAQNKLMLNPSGTGYLLLNPTSNDRLAIN